MAVDQKVSDLLALSPSEDPAALISKLDAIHPQTEEERDSIGENEDFLRWIGEVLKKANSRIRDSGSTRDKELAASVAKLLAEIAKAESARTPLVEADLLPPLVEAHKHGQPRSTPFDEALTVQTLRVFANLCYEHEPVQLEVLKADGLSLFLKVITMSTDKSMRETYGSLAAPAIRALSNILETEQAIQDLLETSGLTKLLHILRDEHKIIISPSVSEDDLIDALEILEALTTVLEIIGENIPIPSPSEDDDIANYVEIRKNVSRIVTLVTMN
ncbi:hypothetical protein HDU76_008876, partial [Blyttiomyces sp. JEL0837]